MIKYYCDKCGHEIVRGLLKIVEQDTNGIQKRYQLCSDCTKLFRDFMKLNQDQKEQFAEGTTDNNLTDSIKILSEVDKLFEQADKKVSDGTKDEKTLAEIQDKVVESAENDKYDASNDVYKIPGADENELSDGIQVESTKSKKITYLTEEIKSYIREHMNTESATSIAKKFGIPYTAVYQYIRGYKSKFGEVDAKPTSTLSANDVGTCVALYRSGWNISAIATEINKEDTDVMVALKQQGMI